MNAGATSERVYQALRLRILHRGFRPGARLDPAVLAGSLAASVTPVRDALHRLVGRDLVETRPGTGFHLPALDAPALVDLYDWSAQILSLALQPKWQPAGGAAWALSPAEGTVADRTAALFEAICNGSDNVEHRRAIDRLNDRLHAVRLVEPAVAGGGDGEIEALASTCAVGDRAEARRLMQVYHRRRRRLAAGAVRALYRFE